VLEERADEDGAFFRFRAAPEVIARLHELSENAGRGGKSPLKIT